MSNLPLLVALTGVIALLYAMLRDALFDPVSILIAIFGIIIGSLITVLVWGDGS